MADGREHIEDSYAIILDVASRLDGQKGSYSDDEFAELGRYVEAAQKWVGLCRKKVWLRGSEGTERAQKCLGSAQKLQAGLDQPSVAVDAAGDLAAQLESLARVIATKSQVLT
jgi:hypothetical protein